MLDDATASLGGPPQTPSGWFALATVGELARRRSWPARLAGEEYAVFRTESGRVAALAAHCPHLGGHLGHGGRVSGETLICPFHGFRFDGDGHCTATGYGSPVPRDLGTGALAVRRVGDVVVAWHDSSGATATWEVEDAPAVGPWRWARRHIRGHPQETTENSVDLGHLGIVHSYRDVRQVAPLEVEGPRLRIGYAMRRSFRFLGRAAPALNVRFSIEAWGLGWSRVDVEVPQLSVRFAQLVLATPTDPGEIDLLLGVAVQPVATHAADRASDRVARLVAAAMEQRVVRSLTAVGFLAAVTGDVDQDEAIWRHKAYLERPRLAVGDGPIAPYRRWASQFYAPAPG